jgi:phage terminase large subunit-like protein
VKLVHASRGKQPRAEPVSAVYEQGRGHHVGTFARLEDQMCQWEPGQASPDRMDALVWLGTELVSNRPVMSDIPQAESKASQWDPFGELASMEWGL